MQAANSFWNISVYHAGRIIYKQETLALVIAAIAAPTAALILCDNQALVYATRTGHQFTWVSLGILGTIHF